MEEKGKRRTNKQIRSSARPQAKAELKNVLLFGVMTKTSVPSYKNVPLQGGCQKCLHNKWMVPKQQENRENKLGVFHGLRKYFLNSSHGFFPEALKC